jgi:mRNA interferase MazF
LNVGDIHWVDFPQANGREQQGRRPAIVMQDDGYAGSLPTTMVIPLSTAKRTLRFAGTALVAGTSESGLRQESVALVFQFRAIDRNRVKERVGTISEDERRVVFDELGKLTGQND